MFRASVIVITAFGVLFSHCIIGTWLLGISTTTSVQVGSHVSTSESHALGVRLAQVIANSVEYFHQIFATLLGHPERYRTSDYKPRGAGITQKLTEQIKMLFHLANDLLLLLILLLIVLLMTLLLLLVLLLPLLSLLLLLLTISYCCFCWCHQYIFHCQY